MSEVMWQPASPYTELGGLVCVLATAHLRRPPCRAGLIPEPFAVLTLLVSVGRGTGFLPTGLCLRRGILGVVIFALGKDGLKVRLSLIRSGSDLSLGLVDGEQGLNP